MESNLPCFTSSWPMDTTNPIVKGGKMRVLLATALLVGSVSLAQSDPARLLSDIPGFDFSRLSASAKRELASVLQDEFDACGRPLTLYASLKNNPCRHTKRLVGLAASMAAEGSAAIEIINVLGKYNQTFANRRATFKVDERQCHGSANAKVTVVEFSDFECPFCAAARPMLDELLKARPFARVCYAPFPLPSHANATIAGQAALFARDAGKFWAMHDALFDNQTSLSEGFILKQAKSLGLDDKALQKVFASGKYVDELNASKDSGRAAGVESTPSLYFNGRKGTLGLSTEALLLMADDENEWVQGGNAWSKE
jgi:protein-disulfide isomerase